MSRPRMLDLFGGGGGMAMGFHRAGFDVVGVDIDPHPDYPFEFIQADATTFPLEGFDARHASPPCTDHTALSSLHGPVGTGWMLEHTRRRFVEYGGVWTLENVEGAAMTNAVRLCGTEFGLGAVCRDGKYRQLRRHRLFESSVWLMGAGGCHHRGEAVGVYGHGGSGLNPASRRGYQATAAEAAEAMGIDWMKHYDVVQAIPPAYAQFLGEQLLEALAVAA